MHYQFKFSVMSQLGQSSKMEFWWIFFWWNPSLLAYEILMKKKKSMIILFHGLFSLYNNKIYKIETLFKPDLFYSLKKCKNEFVKTYYYFTMLSNFLNMINLKRVEFENLTDHYVLLYNWINMLNDLYSTF